MRDGTVVITGGAGFVGSNLAHRLAKGGRQVVLVDSLARPGVEGNVEWLTQQHGDAVRLVRADVRQPEAWRDVLRDAAQVFHFAAQVAVTTSLEDPLGDFDVNARGTLNLLEALRALPDPPGLVFTSTNKVYGALPDVALAVEGQRYVPTDAAIRARGIGVDRPLDFHSPYGCSKGTADQYVIDYARTFGLRTVVFRMSCIYGPRQLGTEDQGWVAHFLIRALQGRPITLYGDGLQVRDLLFVDDLVAAFGLAQENIDALAGRAFTIGGGPANTASLLEVLDIIATIEGRRPLVSFAPWRPGDQRYYCSDTSAFREATGWVPRTGVEDGIRRLQQWLLALLHEDRLPEVQRGLS